MQESLTEKRPKFDSIFVGMLEWHYNLLNYVGFVVTMFSRFFNKNNSEQSSQSEQHQNGETQSSFGNLSAEKLKSVIISLNEAEKTFLAAGFIMEQLDVEFGSQPKLTPHFRQHAQVTESVQEEILEQTQEQQLIRFILISLFKSARMQSLFEHSELYFYGMEIDISSVPCVRTIFRRKESVAEVIPFDSK